MYPVTVSEQILPNVKRRISLAIEEHNSAHRNANRFLEDLVFKYYLDIVHRKTKLTLNIFFRVLVWAIRVV
jgi:hypothetical protein